MKRCVSDVVHLRARGPRLALRDLGDRDRAQLLAHRLDRLQPDLALRRGVAVEGALERLDHLEHSQLGGRAGERVAALHPALGVQDARAPQRREQSLQELDRDLPAARDLADGYRTTGTAARELGQGPDCIRRLGRDGEHCGASIGYAGDAPVTPSIVSRLDPWLPPLLLMAVIFALSAQPDLNSGLGAIDLIGRKIVHMGEYALLVFLWWRALRTVVPGGRAIVFAVVIALGYAATDEFHQHFVHGRHGAPIDVGIDSVGAGLAAYALHRRSR
ncbi:MAG: hypothetical protein QOJ29_4296 [Thermoleophilaceae bacterium]|nr:hypothetical protein [Thermoleophilaceae bacterium]